MKTPLVAEVATALQARGGHVGIVGHGYRGADGGVRVVTDGDKVLETTETVGDEAILLARTLHGCPIVVGKNKFAAACKLEELFGRRILLLDGGFQHLDLARDLDIVSVCERDLGDSVVPAGMLRESPGALAFADVIMTDKATDGPRVEELRKARPNDLFSMTRTGFRFIGAADADLEIEIPKKAFAFCGIAAPERLVADLKAQGVDVVGHRFFRDHHNFTESELREVVDAARKADAPLVVTTAKDAVRLKTWPGPPPLIVMIARIEIDNLKGLLKRIDRAVLTKIKEHLT